MLAACPVGSTRLCIALLQSFINQTHGEISGHDANLEMGLLQEVEATVSQHLQQVSGHSKLRKARVKCPPDPPIMVLLLCFPEHSTDIINKAYAFR